MGYQKRIDHAFANVPCLALTPSSKLVLMSDCHRGIGNTNDNFHKNRTIYNCALQLYYKQGFTYIELGDGDELWENRDIRLIQETYHDIFCLFQCFEKEKRLYLLYGNHDYVKHCPKFPSAFTYHEGLILEDCLTRQMIYLTHGHQADFLNSTLWRLARFLVRYIWKPLELFGVMDPTNASINHKLKDKTEQRLNHWAAQRQSLLITGHTHRAVAGSRQNPYFNSGCCIYPGSITALELVNRKLALVQWTLDTRDDQVVYVARKTISDALPLEELFPSYAQ